MRGFAIIFISLFISCSGSEVPDKVLSPDKIRPIVFDLLRADEFVNNFLVKDTLLKRDVEAIKLYDKVFKLHNVTASEFFSSYKYYQAHPDVNKKLIDSLDAFVNRKRLANDTAKQVK